MARTAKEAEHYACEFTQMHRERAILFGMDAWRDSMISRFDGNVPWIGLESPLEMAFWMWWQVLSDAYRFEEVELMHQQTWPVGGKEYRLDFAVIWRDHEAADAAYRLGIHVPRIGIELDGHEFHEKTREQVTYRNERDRDLQSDGWRLLHFSGSEFNANPVKCVHGIYLDAIGAFSEARYRSLQAQGFTI